MAGVPLTVLLMQSINPSIGDLSWMAGCWKGGWVGRTVTEYWLPPAGGTMIGVSRTVADERTIEYEFILLRTTAKGLEYVAQPSGQGRAVFAATRVGADEAVFESPAYDVPTRIRYRRLDGQLIATLTGSSRGTPREVQFHYRAGDCSK